MITRVCPKVPGMMLLVIREKTETMDADMGGLNCVFKDTCYSWTLPVEIAVQKNYGNNLGVVRARHY